MGWNWLANSNNKLTQLSCQMRNNHTIQVRCPHKLWLIARQSIDRYLLLLCNILNLNEVHQEWRQQWEWPISACRCCIRFAYQLCNFLQNNQTHLFSCVFIGVCDRILFEFGWQQVICGYCVCVWGALPIFTIMHLIAISCFGWCCWCGLCIQ